MRYGHKHIQGAVQLRSLVAATRAGTEAKLNTWRNGKVKELTVVIEELAG